MNYKISLEIKVDIEFLFRDVFVWVVGTYTMVCH